MSCASGGVKVREEEKKSIRSPRGECSALSERVILYIERGYRAARIVLHVYNGGVTSASARDSARIYAKS